MSKENRPNLNAVGLTVDIIQSIEKYKRGRAGKVSVTETLPLLMEAITDFVEDINELLDNEFGEG